MPEEVAAVGSERGLGLFSEAEKLTLADRIGRVQRAWQEPVQRLLIFDNCEDEALLSRWVPVTGGCCVLVTSRQGVWDSGLSVTAIPLDVLSTTESSHLLRQIATHVEELEAKDIAREVGHLPLALHLAGGFLRRYQQISPTSYVAQVRDQGLLRHPSLQGRGVDLSPTGHDLHVARTYAIGWERLDSNDAIDIAARQLLARAATLAPGEPIPARWLKQTIGGDRNDLTAVLLAEDALVRLISMGFLMGESHGSVVLHPLLALFTREVSGNPEIEFAETSVTTMMTQLLSDGFERDGHLSVLPISVVHVRHVSDAAFAKRGPGAAKLGMLLGVHLTNISEYFQAGQVLERAYAAARATGDVQIQARVLEILARTQESMGHAQDALQSSQLAIKLLRTTEEIDPATLVDALYRQGFAYYWLGQADAALASAGEGYQLSLAANLRHQMALCRSLTGVVNYYMLGDYRLGEAQLEEALAIYREVGRPESESSVLNNLGESARLQGNYSRAVRYYEEALSVARTIENQSKVDIIVSNLCGARIGLGQFAEAAHDLEELLARTRHDWFGLSESYRFLAEAYLGMQRRSQAVTMARKALALADQSNLFEHGRAWRVLGQIAARVTESIRVEDADDRRYDAPSCFARSLEYFADGDRERDRALTLWRWAESEFARGDRSRARDLWREANDVFEKLNLPLMIDQMDVSLTNRAGLEQHV